MSFMQQAGITREPPFFETLRQNDWKPRFHYEPSLHRTADAINRPHEDYSHRIPATKDAVTGTVEALRRAPASPASCCGRSTGRSSPTTARAGKWRKTNVQVGSHLAPDGSGWTPSWRSSSSSTWTGSFPGRTSRCGISRPYTPSWTATAAPAASSSPSPSSSTAYTWPRDSSRAKTAGQPEANRASESEESLSQRRRDEKGLKSRRARESKKQPEEV